MKNIHIIQTDKPSKLHLAYDKDYYLSVEPFIQLDTKNYKSFNIYITSDEEITNCDCYVINAVGEMGRKNVFKPIKVTEEIVRKEPLITYPNGGWCKKIILTTDLELQKEGVQSIDDEFLEWFVKNPSCEEVKIEDYGNLYNFRYLILIPKEEPKQETFEEYLQRLKYRRTEGGYKYTDEDFEKYKDYIFNCYKTNLSGYKCLEFMYFVEKNIDNQLFNREPKQKTLKEAAEKLFGSLEKGIGADQRRIWMNGAKWQQENSYSEEEVKNIVDETIEKFYKHFYTLTKAEMKEQWFEQFKKK